MFLALHTLATNGRSLLSCPARLIERQERSWHVRARIIDSAGAPSARTRAANRPRDASKGGASRTIHTFTAEKPVSKIDPSHGLAGEDFKGSRCMRDPFFFASRWNVFANPSKV